MNLLPVVKRYYGIIMNVYRTVLPRLKARLSLFLLVCEMLLDEIGSSSMALLSRRILPACKIKLDKALSGDKAYLNSYNLPGKGALVRLVIAMLVISFVFGTPAALSRVAMAEPANPQLLQPTSSSHVLGFQPDNVYIVFLDHALNTEFLGTQGSWPQPGPGVKYGRVIYIMRSRWYRGISYGRVTYIARSRWYRGITYGRVVYIARSRWYPGISYGRAIHISRSRWYPGISYGRTQYIARSRWYPGIRVGNGANAGFDPQSGLFGLLGETGIQPAEGTTDSAQPLAEGYSYVPDESFAMDQDADQRLSTYVDLWPGVDLTYETLNDNLLAEEAAYLTSEEDVDLTSEEAVRISSDDPAVLAYSTFVLNPHADASRIRLRYNTPVAVQPDGSLLFTFSHGNLFEAAPLAWQEIGEELVPVDAQFTVTQQNGNLSVVGFQLGSYNPRYPLMINLAYAWRSFDGSTKNSLANNIGLDNAGNLNITVNGNTTWQNKRNNATLDMLLGDIGILTSKLRMSIPLYLPLVIK
jgi:hypothetical protein